MVTNLICLFLIAVTGTTEMQGGTVAELTLRAHKEQFKADEPLELEITLTNVSKAEFYVRGDLPAAYVQPNGMFEIQVKEIDAKEFRRLGFGLSHKLPHGYAFTSVEQFIAKENIVAIEPRAFIGRVYSTSWDHLLPGGRYIFRVVYVAEHRHSIASDLEHPLLQERIVSNTVQVELTANEDRNERGRGRSVSQAARMDTTAELSATGLRYLVP